MPLLQDDDKLVCDPSGNPFVLYHGTKASFEVFSDDYLRSMGFHFGCLEQANYFAGRSGRIISVHLLAQHLADIRGSDCGWLHSKATIPCLEFHELISHEKTVELLGTENTSSFNAYSLPCSVEERRDLNLKIMALLEHKG
jgi:ADP-Ribosyltransferase in polyvalent proteins